MKTENILPDQAYLCECFAYDDDLGVLRWKQRPPEHFPPSGRKTPEHLCNIWNVRFADKVAGKKPDDKGYIWISIRGAYCSAHRIIWKMHHGTDPYQVDHKDTDSSNNRIGNLREATHAQNCWNSSINSRNLSGFKGVSYSPEKGRYRARLQTKWLGYFDTAEEAHAVYCAAAKEAFGEFFNDGLKRAPNQPANESREPDQNNPRNDPNQNRDNEHITKTLVRPWWLCT